MRQHLLVLGLALPALAVAGGLGYRSVSAPVVKEAAPAAVVPAAPQPETPTASKPSSEADELLQITMLLPGSKDQGTLADSRRREARERAERLAGRLRANAAAWTDVLDLLCILEPEDKAVALAGLLDTAVDGSREQELLSLLNHGTRQARRVALQLLSSRKNSTTLAALMASAEDVEPSLRLNALLALAERRDESRDAVDAALERRARLDPDPVLQDTARRLLGEQVPSRYPAPVARHRTFGDGIKAR